MSSPLNRNFLITGGSRGLGEEFSRRVLRAGGRVVIADVQDARDVEHVGGGRRRLFVKTDVTKDEDWDRTWREAERFFGDDGVQVLVNNAGVNTNRGWKHCVDVNFYGACRGAFLAVEKWTSSMSPGTVINIASVAGLLTDFGDPMGASYETGKHGVVALTRSLAMCKNNVKHMALCPSWVETDLVKTSQALDYEKMKKTIDFLSVSQVGEAFERLIKDDINGATMIGKKTR